MTRVRGTPAYTFLTGDPRIDSMVRELSRLGGGRPGRFPEGSREGMFREPPPPRPNPLSRQAFEERRANMGPPRRLFVSFPSLSSRSSFIAPQVDSVVDSLRAVLGQDRRFVLVPADSVRQILARTRTTSVIADSMNVDLFASLSASMLPDTSVIWQVRSHDLSAHGSFWSRDITMRRERPDLLKGIDSLIAGTRQQLREMDGAPRRKPASPDSRPQ